jgi:hypothetical protein
MKLLSLICLPGLVLIVLATGCVPSARETETPQPMSTATPTEALTYTPTSAPTAVSKNPPSTIPTLPEGQAKDQLLDLLANNGECQLPCLWGITPGKTTNLEARAILLPLSAISILTHLADDSPDGIWMIYHENELRTSIKLNYLFGSDGVISRIVFKAGETKEVPDGFLPIYDSKTFGEQLHPYMLSGILSEFGRPASVIIQTSGELITGSGGFEILLIYPEQGIFVHYTTQMEADGTNARGCPANAEVELELYPSGDADAFAKALSQTKWAFAWPVLAENPSWKPIDKATSMSVEQFYETFKQPTDKCIETPLKEWYVPQ